jgi:hypothetical protein
MTTKKETACKAYPGRFLAGGTTSFKNNTNFHFILQVRRSFRHKAIPVIINLDPRGPLPIIRAETMEGLRHE